MGNGNSPGGHRAPRHIPLISIHSRNISFNTKFSTDAKLKNGMFVKVVPRMDEYRVFFEFSQEWQVNSYKLGSFGGSAREEGSKSIQAQLVIKKNDWMRSVAQLPSEHRWFKAEKAGKNRWSIAVVPCFEDAWTLEMPFPPVGTGIYRCLDNGSVVSIGMGQIRKRIQDHRRDGWIFQKVEYSLVGDTVREEEFERFWQDRYVEEHGQLPKYNRILGKGKKRKAKVA